MSTELERVTRALEGARHALGMMERNPKLISTCYLHDVQNEIDSILNPPPETEDIEIERFIIFYRDGSTSHVLTREGLQGFDCNGGTAKMVSHTITRPKKQQVERSVQVTLCRRGDWYVRGEDIKDMPIELDGVFTYPEDV